MADIQNTIEKTKYYIESRRYKGWDPYDALSSPLIRALSLGLKSGRIAWTQFFRRSPVNFRRLMGVAEAHNPKGLGLFLWGYARLYAMECRKEHLDRVFELLGLLERTKSPGTSGNGWGYNFDWQSRAAFVPKWTPTVVNSSFIGHALVDTCLLCDVPRALELAMPIADFIIDDLNRKQEGSAFCFSYTPKDENYVHNANMLGASLLMRLYRLGGGARLLQASLESLAYSMNHQHADGSWYYGESKMQNWIDSFHTGFNLQSLRYFLALKEGRHYENAYKTGVKYYAENFFLPDGLPKYYSDSLHPIDIHCPAQAIVFFSSEPSPYGELTDRVMDWTLKNMWDERRGYFYFRKGRLLKNKIPYIRWSQAWCWHALTEYAVRRHYIPGDRRELHETAKYAGHSSTPGEVVIT